MIRSSLMVLTLVLSLGLEKRDPLATAQTLSSTRFAGFVYGSNSQAEKKIDCTEFVIEVVKDLAKEGSLDLSKEVLSEIAMVDLGKLSEEKRSKLVADGDESTRGVARALVRAGIGKEIAPKDAKPGDFVQYWYKHKDTWLGHAAIVEKIDEKGKATLFGSHRTTLQREKDLPESDRKGGIGSGPVFDLTESKRKVYVVRWGT